jgi:hypothetical protein
MPEKKGRFIDKILDGKGPGADDGGSFTSERQHTAQAFNLHVERKDGRSAEGFPWSHYAGYRWTDEGSFERLVVIFGARAVEIEGNNLGLLINEIREGQLNGVRELASEQAQLQRRANEGNPLVITGVKTYPEFEDILKEIKGDDEHETRHTRRFER